MLKTINFDAKYFAGAVASFAIAYMTATGKILDYITFSDVLGEIALFMIASTMGVISMIGAFSKK